jgi:hypothetical protein
MLVGILANVVHYARTHETEEFTPAEVAAAYAGVYINPKCVKAYEDTMKFLVSQGETLIQPRTGVFRTQFTKADFRRMAESIESLAIGPGATVKVTTELFRQAAANLAAEKESARHHG